MTAALTLGSAPGQLTLIVNPGSPFTAELDAVRDGVPYTWPAGTTARISFAPRRGQQNLPDWVGVVAGSAITFTADVATVGVVAAALPRARLYLNTGGGEFLWLSGDVVPRG